ncbi:hypothetical protein D3C71_1413510 [compost metagenome]
MTPGIPAKMVTLNMAGGAAGLMLRIALVLATPVKALSARCVVSTYSSMLIRVARPRILLATVATTSISLMRKCRLRACKMGIDACPPQLIRLTLRSVSASVPVTVGTIILPRWLGVKSISKVPSGRSSAQCLTCDIALVASKTTSKGVGDANTASMPPALVGQPKRAATSRPAESLLRPASNPQCSSGERWILLTRSMPMAPVPMTATESVMSYLY